MAHYDVLSVGDTATDVFIRLADAHIRIWEDDHGHWMDLPFGGKVPFEYAVTVDAGGNAANAAVGFSRLGLSTAIAAHVGSDDIGRTMQASLEHEGVDTYLMRFDPTQPSNRNFVLWFGQDRTILVRHELFDYHWPDLSPREIPRWMYLSSVGSDAPEYYDQIVRWLDAEPSVRFAFQPGTFQIALGSEAMAGIYRRAEVLICNREEAVEIGGGDHGKLSEILRSLHRLGPSTVVVTDGPEGAYASDGSHRYRVPAYPDPFPPKERTGAGDAFSSALVAALVKGLPLGEALAWAPVNAMSVVQDVGSQTGLLSEADLLKYLNGAPKSYCVTTW
ncbi:MAG: carbohydrate kinase family protein [Acidimicrobiales bacterium]|jgi:sugar/nucleoside kinase (ribokinase family)